MNIPRSRRDEETLARIEARERERKSHRPLYPAQLKLVKQTIPRKPEYYRDKARLAKQLGEGYLESVYTQAYNISKQAGLSSADKSRQINRLYHVAEQIIQSNRGKASAPAPVQVQSKVQPHRRRLKRPPPPSRRIPQKQTLNSYILNYIELIKHKKDLLIQFLKKMYENGYVYNQQTRKWMIRRE